MLTVDLPGARALFTTRDTGDLALGQTANRERLETELGVRFAWAKQVHGATVHTVDQPGLVGDGDGVITERHGLAPIVLAADCVPVVMSNGHSVAAIHAGWHGLDEGVLANGVKALGGAGVCAAIGPAAGSCCYEVGEDLHARFQAYDARQGRNLHLAKIARAQLEAAGVERVYDVGICTICSEEHFSHRREQGQAGRQAGIGWLTS
ncbi:MAG: polyphenol oxidase family protein [Solirubrobacterales bacterium]|nr:polyphenol oxidase family protein [Solirubrobacterales bacterium]